MKIIFAFIVFLLLSLRSVFAVTITSSNYPSVILTDQFSLDIQISGPNPGTNYLRIDLYKEGTTNYFGENNNGTTWYGGSDGLQYFPVVITPESSASATIQGRFGNPTLTEYPGPGIYKLRIRRYTEHGNPSSGDQQNPIDVQINISLPTSSPTPSPIPTPVPTSKTTTTPSPLPPESQTKWGTPTPLPPTKPAAKWGTPTTTSEIVLASETSASPLPLAASPSASPLPLAANKPFNIFPYLAIGSGILLLAVSVGFGILKK